MNLLSSGHLRRIAQPLLFRYWLKRGTSQEVTTRVDGFNLRVSPTVFHPKYFGSSSILGRYVESLDLDGKTVLDMGTGSGIIGLFAARKGARVTAVDVNVNAVACALSNALAAGFEIECIPSDLFSALSNRRFDVIAWNPPFFPKPSQTVAEAALYAGDGYASIVRFAHECREHLTSQGRIVLVLSLDIDVEAVESMFEREGFSPRRVLTRMWGLGEKMVVLEMQ